MRIRHANYPPDRQKPLEFCFINKERLPMRSLRSSAIALMLGACSLTALSVAAHAQLNISISANVAPPPLYIYEQPPMPEGDYLWTPGYWAWDRSDADYYWVPGTWVSAPEPDLLWTPPYWGWNDGSYAFHPGYWAREVGYYGGIDYGYGYTGHGYEGGRWERGAFFYNRSVNNFGSVRVTNVYEKAVTVNKTSVRVSFNGGKGGTDARPTPQQEAFAKERHVNTTPLQTKHMEAASKDRALFSKQNHGKPPITATSRPGELDGASRTTPKADTKGEASKPGDEKKSEKAGPVNDTKREMPKAGEEKRSGKSSPANDTKHETPKAEQEKRPEKASPPADTKREAPKAEQEKRSEKASPPADTKREAPKAEQEKRSEKASPAADTKREAPKAEQEKRSEKASPAADTKREAPKAEQEKRPEKASPPADTKHETP